MPTDTFFRLPQEKRTKLLDAALEEFSRVPFAQVSINKIIQGAGIPRGSFYMYFADKEDLFRHLLGTYRQRLCQLACQALDEVWDRQMPLRQLGVQVTKLSAERYMQYDLFSELDPDRQERKARLDETVDGLRNRFGEETIRRARFLNGKVAHMAGGLAKERRTGVTKAVENG